MRRERNPGSASAAVVPSSSFPGRLGRGLPLPSPKGAGAWLPG